MSSNEMARRVLDEENEDLSFGQTLLVSLVLISIVGVFALVVQRILSSREQRFKRYMNDAELGMEMAHFEAEPNEEDEFTEDFPGQHQVRA